MFPEGVVIRSSDDHEAQPSVKFVNRTADRDLGFERSHDDSNADSAIYVLDDNPKHDEHSQETTLAGLLALSERNSELDQDRELHIEVARHDSAACDDSWASGSKFFTVKTIQVEWEQSKHAFMHVFVDTTAVSKLEKAKATSRCLHIMFSSISHEFRTPLNIFANAVELVGLNFGKLRACFGFAKQHAPDSAGKLEASEAAVLRHLKMASVSAKTRKPRLA